MTCAICDNDHSTQRLCKACRADPANADWCEVWRGIEARVDDHADADDVHWHRHGLMDEAAPRSLGALEVKRLKPPTEHQAEIMRLLMEGEWVMVERKTRRKRYARAWCRPSGQPCSVMGLNRGAVRKRRELSVRQVAVRIGVDPRYVRKTLAMYWKKGI